MNKPKFETADLAAKNSVTIIAFPLYISDISITFKPI
jgi:hypothetical protein